LRDRAASRIRSAAAMERRCPPAAFHKRASAPLLNGSAAAFRAKSEADTAPRR
jgi:hypothetical protein